MEERVGEKISSSTSTREKDVTGKAPRERGDGEYTRRPGESNKRGRKGSRLARLGEKEISCRASQRVHPPGDGCGSLH